LKRNPKCVSDLAKDIKEERSKVSHALRDLRSCNFVFMEKEGRKRIYRLNEHTFEPLLDLVDEHVRKYCEKCDRLEGI